MKAEDFWLLTDSEWEIMEGVEGAYYNSVGYVPDLLITGSRVVCNPRVWDTDVDIVVDSYDGIEEDLLSLGFHMCGEGYEESEFNAFRKDTVNILSSNCKYYTDAMRAYTEAAKILNLPCKEDRINLSTSIRATAEMKKCREASVPDLPPAFQ